MRSLADKYKNMNPKTANENEECPLGKLLRPSVIFLTSPWQCKSCGSLFVKMISSCVVHGFPPELGQHLYAKSGRGLPTVSLMIFVITPFRGSSKVVA